MPADDGRRYRALRGQHRRDVPRRRHGVSLKSAPNHPQITRPASSAGDGRLLDQRRHHGLREKHFRKFAPAPLLLRQLRWLPAGPGRTSRPLVHGQTPVETRVRGGSELASTAETSKNGLPRLLTIRRERPAASESPNPLVPDFMGRESGTSLPPTAKRPPQFQSLRITAGGHSSCPPTGGTQPQGQGPTLPAPRRFSWPHWALPRARGTQQMVDAAVSALMPCWLWGRNLMWVHLNWLSTGFRAG